MNEGLLEILLALVQRDQDTRAQLFEQGELYGDYAPEMQQVHLENAERLDEIIEQHGWPGVSLVVVEGCRVAWFIARHSICTPALQRRFLQLLSQAADAGDAPLLQVAFLSDRIRFNENRPQRYGTILDWSEAGELGCELEDEAAVDRWRAEVGLPPFEDDLRRHVQETRAEGGRPPEDFRAYKQNALTWARREGRGSNSDPPL